MPKEQADYKFLTHDNPLYALGIVCEKIHHLFPFNNRRFETIVGTILGEIMRGQYFFVVQDNKVCGYIGWALCDQDTAEKWIYHNIQPAFEQCQEGDCLVVPTLFSENTDVLKKIVRKMRDMFPKKPTYWIRFRKDGSIHRARVLL